MRPTEIIANLPVADIDAARDFYAGYLGLDEESFNLGWVAHFRRSDGGAAGDVECFSCRACGTEQDDGVTIRRVACAMAGYRTRYLGAPCSVTAALLRTGP